MSPLHVSFITLRQPPSPQAHTERMQRTKSSMWIPNVTKYTSTLNPLAHSGQLSARFRPELSGSQTKSKPNSAPCARAEETLITLAIQTEETPITVLA